MNILYETEGKLYRSCSESTVTFTFQLNKEVNELNIYFTYGPKYLKNKEEIDKVFEDYEHDYYGDEKDWLMEYKKVTGKLSSLLTISLDDKNGFRGAGHRQSSEQNIYVGVNGATEGFLPGKFEKGHCTVSINCHAIFSKYMDYKLVVKEGIDG